MSELGKVAQYREVEIWVRGKWKITKGIVIESDLCKHPDCIRKIPSLRARSHKYRKGVPKGYCSSDCYDCHKRGIKPRSERSLDEFNIKYKKERSELF